VHREPSYRYWLMRRIVWVLVRSGYYVNYTRQEMATRPPAAILADYTARGFLLWNPDLGLFTASHYLPYWRDLWLPGLSAIVSPRTPAATWTVPADGMYRVYASPRLAAHTWFRQPLYWNTPLWRDQRLVVTVHAYEEWPGTGVPLELSVPLQNGRLQLKKGQRLTVVSRAAEPIGVFMSPLDATQLFQQPPVGTTLEVSTDPQWHVTDLAVLRW